MKTVGMQFHVSTAEHEAIKQVAADLGVSISHFLRKAIIAGRAGAIKRIKQEHEEFPAQPQTKEAA